MPCSQGRYLVVLEPSLVPLLHVFSAAARGPSPRNQTPGFFILEPVQANPSDSKPLLPLPLWLHGIEMSLLTPTPPLPPIMGRSVLS